MSIRYGGHDGFIRGAHDLPELFPRERIETCDEAAAAEDSLRAAGDFEDRGSGVVRDLGTILLPDDFSGAFVESDEFTTALVVRRDEQHRFVYDGRGTETLVRDIVGHALLPKDFPGRIEGRRMDRLVVEKIHVEPFAVPRDGSGCLRGVAVPDGIERAAVDDCFPERFAGGSIETEDKLLLLGFVGARHVDVIPHDDRCAVTPSTNRRAPDDVFRFAPFHRHRLTGGRVAIGGRAAPSRPVGGGRSWGGQ